MTAIFISRELTFQAVGRVPEADYLRQKVAGHAARKARDPQIDVGSKLYETCSVQPEPETERRSLSRRTDDDRVAAEVEVVIMRRGDARRRASTARREQERGQSAARKPVHRRHLVTRAARARRGLTGGVLVAGCDLLHGTAGTKLDAARLRGDDRVAALNVNHKDVGLIVVRDRRAVLRRDGGGDAARRRDTHAARFEHTADA